MKYIIDNSLKCRYAKSLFGHCWYKSFNFL